MVYKTSERSIKGHKGLSYHVLAVRCSLLGDGTEEIKNEKRTTMEPGRKHTQKKTYGPGILQL
jgi:hypothetical protein